MSSTPPWLQGRSAGVLAHVSSLPGAYGIGNLGATAHAFIDLLAESGMRFWQICPVGPTGYGDSPYQSFSSFAGNPYFIDLAELVAAGLLTPEEVQPLEDFPAGRVDYGGLYERFWPLLRRAAERFAAAPGSLPDYGDFDTFCAAEAAWLEAYALFMTLKQTHGGVAWIDWETRARRGPEAIPRDDLTADQRREVAAQKFLQYVFAGQWERLRAHARERGVQIIGDLPIFVAYDSCDVWQDRAFFQLDAEGRPLAVAGVPPDYFSASGQRWGNPLYDWDRLRADGYAWWLRRLERAFNFFDVIRLDHFRGFDTYWSVPSDAADARAGEWKAGPGSDFLDTVQEKLAHARIIAEDLGYITAEVVELRRRAGLPGMKILQFAYGHDENNVNLPHFHAPNAVVYTGTHDNDTARGWL
ncbi:MAG: 4-alpha-glucanotransferase, partial [Verrucomicrobiota bacterium]